MKKTTTKDQISLVLLSLVTPSFFVSGCGDGKKNPVGSDLAQIRAEGKKTTEMGPQKPVTVTNTVVVEKPQLVIREESTIDDKFLVITPDPQMSFNEGQSSTYRIRARVLIPGVQMGLRAEGLPEGAVLKESGQEKDLYLLTWNPPLYTIPSQSQMRIFPVKLIAQIISAQDAQAEAKLKKLVREREIPLFLFKNQELPRDLKVSGLASEVIEGQEPVPFQVTVKVPGVDDRSPQKPRLIVSYDGVSLSAGNNFLEMDGSRHVIADANRRDAEYRGDFQWRFSLLYDVKNIPAQTQLARDGRPLAGAQGTRVRLSFKVYNPSGLSTPETLVQLKIRNSKSSSNGPRFDFSGVAQQSLSVSRGETLILRFTVTGNSAVQVSFLSSSLVGEPQVTCQDSKDGSQKQNCTLIWRIPCEIDPSALQKELEFEASDSSGEKTSHKLRSNLARPEKNLCGTGRKSS